MFLPFALINQYLDKIMEERGCTNVSLNLAETGMVSNSSTDTIVNLPILLLDTRDILAATRGKHHPMALGSPTYLAHISDMYHSRRP